MPKWTIDQKGVIEKRGNNILVSAAAGSGKTAVLVERIITKIIEDRVEIDELLVVTFTKAAAREMKEKIRRAIDEKIKAEPDNEYLIRQNTLIANANISTIDSFCGSFVRDNFNDIGIDPSFRICDENEGKLLFQEAVDNVLDSSFEGEDNHDFKDMMKLYTDRNDFTSFSSLISNIYRRAEAFPWPKEWLDSIRKPYIIKEGTRLNDIEWLDEMHSQRKEECQAIIKMSEAFLELCRDYYRDGDKDNKIEVCIQGMKDTLSLLCSYDSYEEMLDSSLRCEKAKKLGAGFKGALDKGLDSSFIKELQNRFNSILDAYNEILAKLQKMNSADIIKECIESSRYVFAIIDFVEEVMDEYEKLKEDSNVRTFNDIERMALNILVDPVTKELTDRARAIRETFNEVMVDEYQDVNDLQEEILKALSNDKNLFMVGDVKQSIYGFRMAKPEIFVGKYENYMNSPDNGTAFNLKENFRSRDEVLTFVNNVFFNLMTKQSGGIEYSDDVKLNFGATLTYSNRDDSQVELLIMDKQDVAAEDAEYDNSRALEATVIAERIRELVDSKYQVTVMENGEPKLRDITYSDIAIILRSANTHGSDFENVLLSYDIPCYASGGKGYFDTVEVGVVLAFLSVLDNPSQDIPLITILHSPMFDISNDTFARVRIYGAGNEEQYKDYPLYYAILDYLHDDKNKVDEDYDRLANAVDVIEGLRQELTDTPIHKVIEKIYGRTKYLDYVSAQLNGEYKRANLLALVDKAIDFEKTRFKGLYNFAKYIESIKEYNLEDEEVSLSGENDNVVRIMTMHKSKGLEYPVVFVSEMGAGFNSDSSIMGALTHNKYGIGIELRRELNGNRVKKDTAYKEYIKRKIEEETKAEEARLLYVALTRAKEKLIVTGVLNKGQETFDEFTKAGLDYHYILTAKNRMEWMIRALCKSNKEYLDSITIFRTPKSSVVKEVIDYATINDKKAKLQEYIESSTDELYEEVSKRLSYRYPYEINDNVKAKYSVSEIKHNAMEEAFSKEGLDSNIFQNEDEKAITIPAFMSEKKVSDVNPGALYGTAMHRVMECFDFVNDDYNSSLNEQLDTMKRGHLITEEQSEMINVDGLQEFLDSDVALRMHRAAVSDKLWVEQPFVLQELPKNILQDAKEELEPVIVQGIIDVFFEEDGKIVLLDYKTDKVDSGDELVKRYKAQIDLYAKAIEKWSHLKVKEKLLYSFCLKDVVVVE